MSRVPSLTTRVAVLAALTIGVTLPAGAHVGARPSAPGNPDSLAVVAAVDAYHAALTAGDSGAVERLLAPDALILESGGVETRVEYFGGHLRGDIAFAQAVPRQRGTIRVHVRGDVAWATSTSVTEGQYRGRDINSASAELMVLVRTATGWKIAAIHWSSRARR